MSSQRERRDAPLDMTGREFREAGHELVDRIADFLDSLPERPVTRGRSPAEVRAALGQGGLPAAGAPAGDLLAEATDFLLENSLFNGHPRFLGYIMGSAAPLGALADMLAAAVNPNCGAWNLSPAAAEIEAQTVRWIGEMIGYPAGGGLLVSGGNVANFLGFLAGRQARADWDLRAAGTAAAPGRPVVYAGRETHTWIHKAADLFGLGTDAIRWVDSDERLRLRPERLEEMVLADRAAGLRPLLAVGTAGTVSTGAVDPLPEMAAICRRHGLWFHVDGAYGALAAVLPEASADLRGLALGDSVAVDPHKWLYAPLEVGCVLVRDRQSLPDACSYTPPYYQFDEGGEEPPVNYYEWGLQNSRGFRALKVWLGLRQAGRDGMVRMIRDNIETAQALHAAVSAHPELEAGDCSLSITTFRFVPADLARSGGLDTEPVAGYLDNLNGELRSRLQSGGECYLSNAVVGGRFLLRACVVNFRTTRADVEAIAEIVARIGREVDAGMRPPGLPGSAP